MGTPSSGLFLFLCFIIILKNQTYQIITIKIIENYCLMRRNFKIFVFICQSVFVRMMEHISKSINFKGVGAKEPNGYVVYCNGRRLYNQSLRH